MARTGVSPGQRSGSVFGWVRNLKKAKKATTGTGLEDHQYQVSSLFGFLYALVQGRMPRFGYHPMCTAKLATGRYSLQLRSQYRRQCRSQNRSQSGCCKRGKSRSTHTKQSSFATENFLHISRSRFRLNSLVFAS
jgi:hypothetical protein